MMFSSEDIRRAITDGLLVIAPFSERSIRPSGLTLHLGELLLRPRPGAVVDVLRGVIPEYDEITISREEPFPLHPQEFVLGHTYESVTVGEKLGFLIEGRSTLARVGLTIVQTAMIVFPGHRDRAVTLELANHGANTILLYPKMKIARVALFELKSPSAEQYDDKGKYRDQLKVGRPIFQNEFLE